MKTIGIKPIFQRNILSYILIFFLNACTNNTSHLPSPIELPGAIIGSAIENTIYSAKRRKVENYVAEHYLAIRQDALQGGGESLGGVLDSARIKGNKRDIAINDFIKNYDSIFKNIQLLTENLSSNFVVLYGVKRLDKKINGLSRMQAYQIIEDYAADNFESLRLAVQQGQGEGLDGLASRLFISEIEKRDLFNQQAKLLYRTIYLEIVVVSLMVHS